MTEFTDKKPPKPSIPIKKSMPVSVFFTQEPAKSDIENDCSRDILANYYQKEFPIEPKFLFKQTEFTYKHRAILIDWIHSTHSKFKLKDETLFLAVHILDRYLSVKSIRLSQMQLLAVSILFLACKYEEIYSPDLNELLSTTNNVFFKEQVVQLEKDVLKMLDFAITKPTSVKFFYRFAEIFELNGSGFSFGLYLLELGLDHRVITYKPSVIATSAVLVTHILFHKELCKLKSILIIDTEIKNCASQLIKLLEFARENPLKSVWEKYSKRRHYCVSSLTLI